MTARRVKAQRQAAFLGTLSLGRRPLPLTVHIVRQIGPRGRQLDTDNLVRAAKAIRDGVADALGIDDADPRVAWVYGQERAAAHGVKIELRSLVVEHRGQGL